MLWEPRLSHQGVLPRGSISLGMTAEGDYPGEREKHFPDRRKSKWKGWKMEKHNIFMGCKPLRDTTGAKISFGEVGWVGKPEGTDLEEAGELRRGWVLKSSAGRAPGWV